MRIWNIFILILYIILYLFDVCINLYFKNSCSFFKITPFGIYKNFMNAAIKISHYFILVKTLVVTDLRKVHRISILTTWFEVSAILKNYFFFATDFHFFAEYNNIVF